MSERVKGRLVANGGGMGRKKRTILYSLLRAHVCYAMSCHQYVRECLMRYAVLWVVFSWCVGLVGTGSMPEPTGVMFLLAGCRSGRLVDFSA